MEFAQLPSTTARSTIRTLAAWFCRHGMPTTLRTDGSPPYSSHNSRKLLDRWGVTHVSSLPHNPQSNGRVEANVEKLQLLLRSTAPDGNINTADFVELRNTPDASGRSPAETSLGHQFCSSLPRARIIRAHSFATGTRDFATRKLGAVATLRIKPEDQAHHCDHMNILRDQILKTKIGNGFTAISSLHCEEIKTVPRHFCAS